MANFNFIPFELSVTVYFGDSESFCKSAQEQSTTQISQDSQSEQQNNHKAEAPVADSSSISASSNDSRKVSRQDIELVQNLIERCLQLYMNRDEVVKTLLTRARIDPGFTTLVWQKLEEENADFFRAYYIRLKLKKQILLFNHLLEHQYHLMKYPVPSKVPLVPMQNGMHPMPVNNLPMGYPVLQQTPMPAPGQPHLDSMSCGMSSCHVVNGVPAPGNFHPIRMNDMVMGNSAADTAHAVPPSSAISSMSEMPVSPTSVTSSGHFPFTTSDMSGIGVDSSALDTAFSDVASSVGLQLGPDGGAGNSRSLDHFQWNFSLSDLSEDLSNLGDLGALGNYPGSPFLPSDSEILLDSPENEDIVEEFFADSVPGPPSQSDEEKFQDWSSEKSFSSEQQYSNEYGFNARKTKQIFFSVCDAIRRGWEIVSERIRSLKKPLRFDSRGAQRAKEPGPKKKILDPQGPFLQKWNKIIMIVCVLAVAIDPLFFYIPWVNSKEKCLDVDKKMQTAACILRTVIDALYVFRILFQFRTGFIAPSSRVFGRGELVEDPKVIAKKYLTSYFIVDILAILPLPQVVVVIILPLVDGPVSLATKNLFEFVILSQYIPRFARIYPLFKEINRTSGVFTETAWAGAVFNLFLYMLASHIFGAFWYLFSIEREDTCWHEACKDQVNCHTTYWYCGDHRPEKYTFPTGSCPYIQPDQVHNSTVFNFGIFIDALDSGLVESTNFPRKFFYCFWWGLRNLRVEEMRVKRRDTDQWMSHRMLPDNLRERIRRYEQYKWQETRGVEERGLIRNLPKDLRRDINRHLCLDLIKKVPIFEKMDEKILDAVCDRLKATLYPKDSYIVREGDPVDEMLFIMRGNLVSVTTNGGRTGFFNAVSLKAGDFCGEMLLTWALDPQSSSNLPISTRTVQALSEVEAFSLEADDLKSVASQFRQLNHKDIQHTFRQWKTWAACFIQAAWRSHCRRKQAKSLRQAELQHALANEASASPSLGAAIYVSRFAAIALRNLRQNGTHATKLPHRLSLLPQKPTEPDFSAQQHK
ncbi:hypothetical protein SADUNF_Sadunf14G0069200 [Salix dunnii]|uniref:Cyclic nucleotide-binding domain-containing protein n=1 Tax=Salix dunnii TaxID=1413687 RepID=A0A835MJQ5_9ROSI|nr:hypothetical protein SADUNF_Sadunf14G0069200 [Salix dunnii]